MTTQPQPQQQATDTVNVTIDGVVYKARKGRTILEAALDNGVYIPYLCWHPILKSYGACRMCVVEVEKQRGTPASCTTQVAEGMVVKTNSENLYGTRKEVMELLLSEHPHGCLTCHRIEKCGIQDICQRNVSVTDRCVVCPQNERCELQDVNYYMSMKPGIQLPYKYRSVPLETRNPFIDHDMNLCIVCGRCVRACNELEGVDAITFVSRGKQTLIGTSLGGMLDASGCTMCGVCVDVCPVGAMVEKDSKWKMAADQQIQTTCTQCSVGCEINLSLRNGKVIRAIFETTGITSHGQTCVKGKFSEQFIYDKARITKPLVRQGETWVETSWAEALKVVSEKLSRFKGSSFGAIASAKGTNEELFSLQKFVRNVMNSGNIDFIDPVSPPATFAPLISATGTAAMANSYDEIGNARMILAVNTDVNSDMPVLGSRIRKAVQEKGTRLVVIDSRGTELAMMSHPVASTSNISLWLRPKAGTEVVLVNAIAKALIDQALVDPAIGDKVNGLEALKASLAACDINTAESITGVNREKISLAVRTIGSAKPGAILFSTGTSVNGDGAALSLSLANLAALTGAGLNPLRGESNSQGAADMGVSPTYLPGYAQAPSKGLGATEMLQQAGSAIKAMFIFGDASNIPGLQFSSLAGLEKLDFLVVADISMTDAAKKAHVILPLTSWAEKDGTFTNAERRMHVVQKAIPAQGASKTGLEIISDIAAGLGNSSIKSSVKDVQGEIEATVPTYKLAGLSSLGSQGARLQVNTSKVTLTPAAAPRAPQAPAAHDGYIALNYLIREIDGVMTLSGKPHIEFNNEDATAAGLANGDTVEIETASGRSAATVATSSGVSRGYVCIAHPWVQTMDAMLHRLLPPEQARLSHTKTANVKVRKLAAVAVVR